MKTALIPLRRHVHVMGSHVPLFLLLTTFLGPTCVSMSAAPPVVQIIAPAPGTTLVQGDVVRISADVSTPGTWLQHAEFYENGVLVGIEDHPRCPALGQCQAALFWTNLTLGTHVLTVIAMDRNLVRGTSAVTIVNVDAPAPATLTWTGAAGTHWNTADPNWTGLRTMFHQGDSVRFTDSVVPGSETLFIGQQLYPPWGSTPLSMFPASITISNHAVPYHLDGGVLRSGSLMKLGTGEATLQKREPYDSTSFDPFRHLLPGGTVVREGRLTYHCAADADPQPFGTAPVVIDGGEFIVRMRYTSPFANPIHVTAAGGALRVDRDLDLLPLIGYARLGGELRLGGSLHLDGSDYGFEWDELSGPIVIDQSTNGPRALRFDGPIRITGPIVDGPGFAVNGLRLASSYQMRRITNPSNTYAGGTIISSMPPGSEPDPDWVGFAIEVDADSSLGTGPVTVESTGLLRLLGSHNIHPHASIHVQGWLYITNDVEVQVASATLGSMTYTSGLFHAGNSDGHILGGGALRVVSVDSLRIDRALSFGGNNAYMEFKSAPGLRYTLEATDALRAGAWSALLAIPSAPTGRVVRITNSLPSGVMNRFYRIRQP